MPKYIPRTWSHPFSILILIATLLAIAFILIMELTFARPRYRRGAVIFTISYTARIGLSLGAVGSTFVAVRAVQHATFWIALVYCAAAAAVVAFTADSFFRRITVTEGELVFSGLVRVLLRRPLIVPWASVRKVTVDLSYIRIYTRDNCIKVEQVYRGLRHLIWEAREHHPTAQVIMPSGFETSFLYKGSPPARRRQHQPINGAGQMNSDGDANEG